MSSLDEREWGQRVDRALATITSGPAPAAAIVARGRRVRRRRAARAGAVAAVAVLAVAVPAGITVHDKLSAPGPAPASQQGAAAPVSLRSPIEFRQVAAMTHGPCPAGSKGLPDSAERACIHLTSRGLTVTTARSAVLVRTGTGQYVLYLTLTRAQTRRFAALTRQISGLENPRDQLAVIASGRLITHPAIQGPITDGSLQIDFATRAQAQRLLPPLPNRCHHLPQTGLTAPGHPPSCQQSRF